jgi:hypothetical protein
VGDGWLGNPVPHAVPKLVRLRSDCEALGISGGAEGAKALGGGTELGGGVAEARRNL